MSRKIPSQALDLIKQFEGLSLKAYRCPAGVWTIGYGSTRHVTPTLRIDEAEAEQRLLTDVTDVAEAIERLVKADLTDNQFSALLSFVFNLGASALAKSTLLKYLNRGLYDKVPGELQRWTRADDRVLPGLVRRRKAEADLWTDA